MNPDTVLLNGRSLFSSMDREAFVSTFILFSPALSL
jgi:hypothetical protein